MMIQNMDFDVVIIGGSYAGLSAAMALGRSRRGTLIIDAGDPCNKQTPHSHNFLTQDGVQPEVIASIGREQVLQYPTVQFYTGIAEEIKLLENGWFEVSVPNRSVRSRKVIIATGLRDIMPSIPGFSECWGRTVIHCPYCHGYEVRDQKTGILAQGDMIMEMVRLIDHWTKDLTLFTNGPAEIADEDRQLILNKGVAIMEQPIREVIHKEGKLQHLVLEDGTKRSLLALYARVKTEQKSPFATMLGCNIGPMGLIETSMVGQTNVTGVYAAGDCTHPMRSVATAVASGNLAGAMLNKELIDEDFMK